jgi:RNA polymerase sigma-70 factor (ECF subfamily)
MNARERQNTLESARGGDAAAWGMLLEAYRPYVRVLVRALCGGRLQVRVDDSDLVQEALLEAHRNFSAFRGTTVAELTAWLRQIVLRKAAHTLRDHLGTDRRTLRREQPVGDLAGRAVDEGHAVAQAIRHEQAARMAEALGRLPDDMQQVLLGRHVDDLPYAVLAERMGRSEGALRVLYSRALRRLRLECRPEPEG